jgi:hypothetical protein
VTLHFQVPVGSAESAARTAGPHAVARIPTAIANNTNFMRLDINDSSKTRKRTEKGPDVKSGRR